MERIVEPELMEGLEQVKAYAEADFEEPHSLFLTLFDEFFPNTEINGLVLDLGCGHGDIARRFARQYTDCLIHGIDGSAAMIAEGQRLFDDCTDLKGRIALFEATIPDDAAPHSKYDVIISNSLLHHLHQPQIFWSTIHRYAKDGTLVFVMDLLRPQTPRRARALVKFYVADAPDVLRRDFYNSLLAAFEVREVQEQIREARLDLLQVREVGDRHIVIAGKYQSPVD